MYTNTRGNTKFSIVVPVKIIGKLYMLVQVKFTGKLDMFKCELSLQAS